jgi:hypothetical protein
MIISFVSIFYTKQSRLCLQHERVFAAKRAGKGDKQPKTRSGNPVSVHMYASKVGGGGKDDDDDGDDDSFL